MPSWTEDPKKDAYSEAPKVAVERHGETPETKAAEARAEAVINTLNPPKDDKGELWLKEKEQATKENR